MFYGIEMLKKKKRCIFQPLLIISIFFISIIINCSGANYSEESCPKECNCNGLLTVIFCNNRKLNLIPMNIPQSAKILYLGENRLTEIKSYSFQNLSNLTALYLNGNKISTIDEKAFYGLSSLTVLSLTQNSLTDLSGKIFEDNKQLKTLYLMHNSLLKIPDFLSVPLRNLNYLNLDTNKLQNANLCWGHKDVIFDNLESLTLSTNENISNITASDFSCVNRKKLIKLNLSRCKLKYIGPEALNFEKLQSISLSYCDLKKSLLETIFQSISVSRSLASVDLSGIFNKGDLKLDSETFKYLPNSTIKYLELQKLTDVSEIENGTFKNFPMLETLDFSNSDIADFKDSLVNCGKLYTLKFWNNRRLGESSISRLKLKNLKTLQVSECQIEKLNNNMFEGIPHLENVTFKNCKIHQINQDSFWKLINLKNLDLSGNTIGGSSLSSSFFSSCTKLESINLSNNKMTIISTEYTLFKNLFDLKSINLSNNLCSGLNPLIFSDQANLKVLDLSGNKLGNFFVNDSSSGLFTSLQSLEFLNLQNNEVSVVPKGLFEHLPKLQNVNLSKNYFNSFKNLIFNASVSLRRISLSGNKFSSVNVPMLLKLPENSSVDLSDNPFDCSCDLREFRFWIDSINISKAENKLLNLKSYKCNSPNQLSGSPILNFDPNSIWAFCNWVYILIFSLVLLAIILVTALLLLFKFRWVIRLKWYLLKKRCAKRRRGPDDERQPLIDTNYNLAISYMDDDSGKNWVNEILLPKLHNFGIKLDKIFTYDEMELGSKPIDVIPNAFYSSSKLLICLSKAYLSDPRRIHYEIPLCIQSRIDGGHDLRGPKGIVLVLLDPSINNPKEIPKSLRILMGNDGEDRCIEWCEEDEGRQELFWEDLKKKLI